MRRVWGVDSRRPVPLQDLHSGVSRRLSEGVRLPACRSLAGDERYSPHCYWLELLLLRKSELAATTITHCISKHADFLKRTDRYQNRQHVGFSVLRMLRRSHIYASRTYTFCPLKGWLWHIVHGVMQRIRYGPYGVHLTYWNASLGCIAHRGGTSFVCFGSLSCLTCNARTIINTPTLSLLAVKSIVAFQAGVALTDEC